MINKYKKMVVVELGSAYAKYSLSGPSNFSVCLKMHRPPRRGRGWGGGLPLPPLAAGLAHGSVPRDGERPGALPCPCPVPAQLCGLAQGRLRKILSHFCPVLIIWDYENSRHQ